MTEILDLINEAKRPVILAGWGVRAAGAVDDLRILAEHANIPITLTWKAIDLLPEAHVLNCGRPGAIGERGANAIIQACDLLICIGARVDKDQVGFRKDNFAPLAKKIVVDIDPLELRKHPDEWIKIEQDAKTFITSLRREDIIPHDGTWAAKCRGAHNKHPVCLPEYWQEHNYVNYYCFVEVLSELCEDNDLLAIGSSGASANGILQAFRIKAGHRMINFGVLGAMGADIPTAIGACIASGKKRTICCTGDGGFQLNIHDLEVIRRLKLPVKFFILSNGGYGSILNMQDRYFGKHYVGANRDSGLTLPGLGGIASAYGLNYAMCYNNSNLWARVRQALNVPTPFIVELNCAPVSVQAPRVQTVIENGKLVSKPMDDLAPSLPAHELEALRKELLANNL
jgi:acetolactate synthase-1/2/3 large subunit